MHTDTNVYLSTTFERFLSKLLCPLIRERMSRPRITALPTMHRARPIGGLANALVHLGGTCCITRCPRSPAWCSSLRAHRLRRERADLALPAAWARRAAHARDRLRGDPAFEHTTFVVNGLVWPCLRPGHAEPEIACVVVQPSSTPPSS